MKRVLMGVTVAGLLAAASAAFACPPNCEADCTTKRNGCIAACDQMYPDPNAEAPAEGQLAPRDRCEGACADGETACVAYCAELCAPPPPAPAPAPQQ
jgi:hypothetical protein